MPSRTGVVSYQAAAPLARLASRWPSRVPGLRVPRRFAILSWCASCWLFRVPGFRAARSFTILCRSPSRQLSRVPGSQLIVEAACWPDGVPIYWRQRLQHRQRIHVCLPARETLSLSLFLLLRLPLAPPLSSPPSYSSTQACPATPSPGSARRTERKETHDSPGFAPLNIAWRASQPAAGRT